MLGSELEPWSSLGLQCLQIVPSVPVEPDVCGHKRAEHAEKFQVES